MERPSTENSTKITKLSEGFSKLSKSEREQRLLDMGVLAPQDLELLSKETALDFNVANHFVENVIGCFPIPLGVAVNFVIDGKAYVIPMAIEETSVIAAASKNAKWIQEHGEITTKNLSQLGVGQIQIPRIKNLPKLKEVIAKNSKELIGSANKAVLQDIVTRGGGISEILVRVLSRGDGDEMGVIHVLVDTCDAMGANTINQVCEFLKPKIENLTNEELGMCILSNLADTKITQARVIIRNIDPELGNAIAEGSLFAQIDPYRAVTNNKGVMNGMDGILIATGNDWRAVESGIHAYAAMSGRYTSITNWYMEDNDLHGVLEAPILVGIVGGVTRLHPVAQICLKMLRVKSANELARVVAAAGLVQNLAAIRALVTQGITQGHMKLHISNLAMAVGAKSDELLLLKQRLAERLEKNKRIMEADAVEILREIRKQ